jgi:dihydroorotase-like cyclic amidohydrolase
VSYDLLVRNGRVIDPRNGRDELADVALSGGRVVEVGSNLPVASADRVLDAAGSWVVPGLVDIHVHLSSEFNGAFGHSMLARAGVTTALDMAGPVDDVLDVAMNSGVGLTIGVLDRIKPGERVPRADASRKELTTAIELALDEGAFGVKILGGHYPLTPEATRATFEIANHHGCWSALHCGTTETGSDIRGLREAMELTAGLRAHIAHINSYCRGSVERAEAEALEAIDLLAARRDLVTESYLAVINGTSGHLVGGRPESGTCRNALRQGGYEESAEGMERSILDGYAYVHAREGDQTVLITGVHGRDQWLESGTHTGVSFPANPPAPRLMLASAKTSGGEFVVGALATDGGGIPRNDLVSSGIRLVDLGVLTPAEWVLKTSSQPAALLGCQGKGHLGEGADGDIAVIDAAAARVRTTIAGGHIIMHEGIVVGRGTRVLTTPRGEQAVHRRGLATTVFPAGSSGMYAALEARA